MTRRQADPGDRDEVYRISAAPKSLSDEVDERTRRYLWSMALRTVCFIGAVVCWVVIDQIALAWVLLVGAVLLPYVAVVVANAGRERRNDLPTATLTDQRPALPTGAGGQPEPEGRRHARYERSDPPTPGPSTPA